MGLLSLFANKKQEQRALLRQDMKARVVKSREAVLEVFSQNMAGVKPCPILLGEKCMGAMCTFFLEFKEIDNATKHETPFWRCTFVQTPLLLIELNRNITQLTQQLLSLLKREDAPDHATTK